MKPLERAARAACKANCFHARIKYDACEGPCRANETQLQLGGSYGVASDIISAIREPSETALHAAFVAMNETPSGRWRAMKAEHASPEDIFTAKMVPRWHAMIDKVLAND